jgi:hypothetical protein
MVADSRRGVIEVLPALPPSLVKGSISDWLARTFARIDKLSWGMKTRTLNLTVTSVNELDVALVARHGIQKISAPSGVLAAQRQAGKANVLCLCRKENRWKSA